MKEDRIIDLVTTQFFTRGIDTNWKDRNNASRNEGFDGYLLLDKFGITLKAEVKQTLRQHQFQYILFQKEKCGENFIFLAETIPPALQIELKNNFVNYADAQGNMYIELSEPMLFIHHSGQKAKLEKEKVVNLSPKMAIFLLFLLENKVKINETVRALAETTKTSNDTIQKTKDWLKSKRYITRLNEKEYIWADWRAAYNRWLTAYEENIRPKQLLGTYTLTNIPKKDFPKKGNYHFTGEYVLEYLDLGLLNTQLVEIYTDAATRNTIIDLRLKPDNQGNVKIYKQFWQWKTEQISPLIIYADLLLNHDARVQTITKKYEDEYIRKYY